MEPLFKMGALIGCCGEDTVTMFVKNTSDKVLTELMWDAQIKGPRQNETVTFLVKYVDPGATVSDTAYTQDAPAPYSTTVVVRGVSICMINGKYYRGCSRLIGEGDTVTPVQVRIP